MCLAYTSPRMVLLGAMQAAVVGLAKKGPMGLSRWVWVASLGMLRGSCGFMNSSEYTQESESEGYSGTWLLL